MATYKVYSKSGNFSLELEHFPGEDSVLISFEGSRNIAFSRAQLIQVLSEDLEVLNEEPVVLGYEEEQPAEEEKAPSARKNKKETS
jgi:hypothetical protein